MIDILFFLFITAFFIYKLKNNFGKRVDDEADRRKSIEEFFRQKYSTTKGGPTDMENIIDITDRKPKDMEVKLNLDFKIPDNVKTALISVGFDQENFLKGVESDVEMVNDAFSDKDVDTLKSLLSNDMFNDFKTKIDNLNANNKILKSSLISIQSKKIEGISMKDNEIFIDVLLRMEQINYIENSDKQVVMGDKKRIDIVNEKWTFKRAIKSKANFWIVSGISNIE